MHNAILAEDVPDVLPQFITARLNGDSFYANIVIVTVDPGDLVQDIQQKLSYLIGKGGKCGVAVLIMPVEMASDTEGNPSVGPLRVVVKFQIWEQRLINQSASGVNIRGYGVARHTFALFKSWSAEGVVKILVPDPTAIEPLAPPEGTKLRCFGVNFTGREDDNFIVPKVARPSMTPASGAATSVTLACSTAGASIWFTEDSTPPDPNGSATQGGNLVTGSPVYDGSGHYAVTVTNGLSYVIQDANGNFLSNVVASGSTYTLTGTAGAAVTQQMFLASAQQYTAPISVPSGGFTLYVQAVLNDYFPSDTISSTFTN